MPDPENTCYFCKQQLSDGAGYARLALGVQGKGEIGAKICTCFDCIKEKGPTILEWAQKAMEFKDILGLFMNKE
jgi:hypothetical protein